MQLYATSLSSDIGFITLDIDINFRPSHIFTDVTEEGQAVITGIFVGKDLEREGVLVARPSMYYPFNTDDGVPNQLIQPVDAYLWSMTLKEKLDRAFFHTHNLIGKSYSEIDRFLDENELTMPDNNRIYLPTIRKGETIRITGDFKKVFHVSFRGYAAL